MERQTQGEVFKASCEFPCWLSHQTSLKWHSKLRGSRLKFLTLLLPSDFITLKGFSPVEKSVEGRKLNTQGPSYQPGTI